MTENRRKEYRRPADRALEETIAILQILEKISRGEDLDFGEHYADLVGVKDRIGRRDEDRKLGESLCSAIEAVALNIGTLLEKYRRLRKVKITKLSGKEGASVDVQSTLIGWEEARPRVGKNYRVFKEDGGIFRSALVVKMFPGHFQTQNSVYRIEVLQET
jgi:hypothetical protein